jgi:hypothetical protein
VASVEVITMRQILGNRKWVVATVVAVSMLLVGWLVWSRLKAPEFGHGMLRFAPADTIGVGFLDLSEHLSIEDVREQVLANPDLGAAYQQFLSETKWNLDELDKWFVPAYTCLVLPDSSGQLMMSQTPEAAMIVPVKDKAAFEAFMKEQYPAELESVEVLGETCYLIPGEDGLISLAHGHLLAASSVHTMERLFQAFDGEQLADTPEFQAALDELHNKSPILFGYGRLDQLGDLSVPWVVGSVAFQDGVVTTEGFLRVLPGSPLGKVVLQKANMDGAGLAFIPPDASGVTALDLGYCYRVLAALAMELGDDIVPPSELATLEAALGGFQGEAIFYTDTMEAIPRWANSAIYGGGPPEISGLMVARAADDAQAEEYLSRLKAELGEGTPSTIRGKAVSIHEPFFVAAVAQDPVPAVVVAFGPRAESLMSDSLKAAEEGPSAAQDPMVSQLMRDSKGSNLVMLDYTDFYTPVQRIVSTYGALLNLVVDMPAGWQDLINDPHLKRVLQGGFYLQATDEGLRYRGYGVGNPVSLGVVIAGYLSLIEGVGLRNN